MNKKFTFKNYFLFFSLFILSAQAYSQSNDKDLNDENEQIIKTEKSDSSNSNMDTINLSSPSISTDNKNININKFKYNAYDKEYSDEYKQVLNAKFKIVSIDNENIKKNIETKQLKNITTDLVSKKQVGSYIQFDFDTKRNKYPLGVISRIINDNDVLYFKFENGSGGLGYLITNKQIDLLKLEADLEEISGVDFTFNINQ